MTFTLLRTYVWNFYIARIWEIQIETSSIAVRHNHFGTETMWNLTCLVTENAVHRVHLNVSTSIYIHIFSFVDILNTKMILILSKEDKKNKLIKICNNFSEYYELYLLCGAQHPHIVDILTASTCLMKLCMVCCPKRSMQCVCRIYHQHNTFVRKISEP